MEADLGLDSACSCSLALHFMHLHLHPGEQDDAGHAVRRTKSNSRDCRGAAIETLKSAWRRADPPEMFVCAAVVGQAVSKQPDAIVLSYVTCQTM